MTFPRSTNKSSTKKRVEEEEEEKKRKTVKHVKCVFTIERTIDPGASTNTLYPVGKRCEFAGRHARARRVGKFE